VTAQDGYAWRFAWGVGGLRALAPEVDAIVIVDVLRFTTAVTVAVERGSSVVPAVPAVASEGSAAGPWVLSPRWVGEHPSGSQLVLPSPNGGVLALATVDAGARWVVAASLRNASAVGRALLAAGTATVGVIAAGEQSSESSESGGWRTAVEDLLGAGAVLAALDPAASVSAPGCSPEAAAARAAFVAARPRLADALAACATGRELAARGFADDVSAAAQLDVSNAVPVLQEGVFVGL
jgi:2-phosphosulfolactate phosphatase